MTLLSCENIIKKYNDRYLFSNLNMSINTGDRIGLVGPNGIGKTTLFEIVASQIRPDEGELHKSKNCNIGYIRQDISQYDKQSLFDFTYSARADLIEIRSAIADLELQLEKEPESDTLLNLLGEQQSTFESLDGYNFEAEIKIILIGLGFPQNRFHNKLSDFSGGEKNRAALARILAGQADLLLLDEPTNHLDIDSTIWLEEYLNNLDIAYIIVSHDRTFLNNTIEKIWEISGGKISQYFNGFEKYLEERKDRIKQLEHLYKHQQEEIKRIEDFIRRNMAGQKTKQAQSKQKYLARMKKVELPQNERVSPKFSMTSSGRSFNLILSLEKATFGYGHHALIKQADFNLYRGERVGFVGRNGSGKTTILKTILGDLELIDGSAKVGPKVDIAYFDQELVGLNEENIVIDEIWELDPASEAGALRSFLARFGFIGEDAFKKIAFLSGGEKTKLALAKIMFQPANFLIFDEPTNHLDIDARLALEEALKSYDGAYLIVSHDRHFLDQIADKIIAVEKDQLKVYMGNYSYYKSKLDELEPKVQKKKTSPDKSDDYARFKEMSRKKGRIKKELQKTRSDITRNEKKLHDLEEELQYNIPKNDWENLNEAASEKTRIEELLLELYSRLDELERINAQDTDA